MATVDLTGISFILLRGGDVSLGNTPNLEFEIGDQYSDSIPTIAKHATVVHKVHGTPSNRVWYKGLVVKYQRQLERETLLVQCTPAEMVLEGLFWEPTLAFYNTPNELCGNKGMNITLQEFVDLEYNDVDPLDPRKVWFTGIDVGTHGSKIIAAVSTFRKSFLTVLNEVISIYPQLKWVIDYDDSELPAVGALRLIDTTVGATPHTLRVGGTGPQVLNYDITEDYSEVPGSLVLYGRGEFTELEETVSPGWPTVDEVVEATVELPAPFVNDQGLLVSYFPIGDHTLSVPPVFTLVLENLGPPMPIFYQKDFGIDFKNQQIVWHVSGLWIDEVTGQLYNDGGAGRRRLAGHPDNTEFMANFPKEVTYKYMSENAFKLYNTTLPIANFKIKAVQVPDPQSPGDNITVPKEVEPVIDSYSPNIYRITNQDQWTNPWEDGELPPNEHIAVLYTPSLDFVSPLYVSHGGDEIVDNRLDNYNYPQGQPQFQEGTPCLVFDKFQLAMNSALWWPDGTPLPPFISWPVKVRYTGWENLAEVRPILGSTSPVALRFVLESAYKYTDILGNVLVDLSGMLAIAADALEEYYSYVPWVGSITVAVEINATSNLPEIPYRIGDKVTWAADSNLDATFKSDFVGIITNIDMSQYDQAVVTLTIGRIQPAVNPFMPPPPTSVDLESVTTTSLDTYSLERI